MIMPDFIIRFMAQDDIPAVMRVQEEAYGTHFLEPEEVIAARYHSGLQTAWVAEIEGMVKAYLVGYDSKIGKIGPLSAEFCAVEGADCFYLHDLALAPAARGLGVGKAMVEAAGIYAQERKYNALALLSVQHSQNYWAKYGFAVYSTLDTENQRNLETYLIEDGSAHYMVRLLK